MFVKITKSQIIEYMWNCFLFSISMTFSPEMSQQASHTPLKFSELSLSCLFISVAYTRDISVQLLKDSLNSQTLLSDQSTLIESRCCWHLKYTSLAILKVKRSYFDKTRKHSSKLSKMPAHKCKHSIYTYIHSDPKSIWALKPLHVTLLGLKNEDTKNRSLLRTRI